MDMSVAPLGDKAREVTLTGRLDTAGVDHIETRFNAAAVSPGRPLVLDLADVSFVSSMGVRMLITAAKRLKAQHALMVLHVPAGPVREMLEVASLDSLIPMFATLDEARASVLQHAG